MSVSSVRIYINMALEYLDSPYRVDDVEPNLVQAEQRLANLSPEDAAPLVAQIADIRAKLDNLVKPADARQISAAQGKIRQARDYIDTNRGRLSQSDKDFVEELFRGAVQFLDQITDANKADRLKAPVLDEIAQIRAQYGTDSSAPPPPPKPATPPPPSQNYYNAKRAVFWANEYFTSPGRIGQVEPELAKAETLLEGDGSAEAAGLAAEIASMREKLADMVSPEDERNVSAAQGKLRQIRNHADRNGGRVSDSDKEFFEQLCRGAVEYLDKITHPRKADELKAPVLAEISRIRAQYGVTGPAPSAPAPAPPSKPQNYPPPSQNFYNAKRKVFWANDYFTTPGRIGQTEPELAQAEELLKNDASREADDLRAEIAGLRQKVADMLRPSGQGQARSVPGQAQSVDMNTLSFDDQDRLNRAKRAIGQARNNIESNRTEGVENLFFDATSLMAPVGDAHKTNLVAEIEQLRRDLEATRLAESTRRLTGELDRGLGRVEMDTDAPDRLPYSVQLFKQRLEQDDVRQTLTPEAYRGYETRLAELLAAGAARVKAETLDRANPALQRLHDRLAANPFTDLTQYDASKLDGELRSMRWQVEREITKLPDDDADRLRIHDELKRTDAQVEAYSNDWALAGVHKAVRHGWQMILDEIAGWEDEALDADAAPLDDPRMPQTRLAIQRVHYYLHRDSSAQGTRDENPGDAVVAAVDAEAGQLLAAAGSKLAAAFDALVAAAEQLPPPVEDRWLRDKPGSLLSSARGALEGTASSDAVLARIQALDTRWQGALADVQKAREELGAKLARDALQQWPATVAAIPDVISAANGFDPSAARPGDAVLLAGVYNRAGWDFDGGQYGFAMRFAGVPLGGVYEGYVDKALDHAAYELKLAIDDHKPWDVVGVVLGPGSIRERTKRVIRRGGVEETVEEWLPIDCLRLRVVALRAGPVVVGPQS
ncbi:hypothetical protein B0T26DRAFT_782443 [Lasiosphaeria miniovina]|uniref:Uncharacterized protein n=1 Tax=Lasiosphaeria miniovina TaxID=1954250 RepID=A0AA40DRG8_9PEZI|nr:uncharacterized protein B0T26DRAFT_782443 [Lasiosphaeria miniovina]KAK0713479.1 hypothetical protein B0T26DRAFT_782443 [Lasiosphaeria miniovina]